MSLARGMPAHTHLSRNATDANVDIWFSQAGHHSMVGSTKDPKDGKAVAGSVFAAVVVYAVCYTRFSKDISFLVIMDKTEVIS